MAQSEKISNAVSKKVADFDNGLETKNMQIYNLKKLVVKVLMFMTVGEKVTENPRRFCIWFKKLQKLSIGVRKYLKIHFMDRILKLK